MSTQPSRRCRECAASLDGRPAQARSCSTACAKRKYERSISATPEGRAKHKANVVRSRERVRLRNRSAVEVAAEDAIMGIG